MHNHWNSEKKSISKINADVVLLMLVKMQLTSSAATTISLSIYFSKRLNQQTWTRITCVCTHTWLRLHGRRQLNYWQVVRSYWNFDLCFSKFIFLTASALISILKLWSFKTLCRWNSIVQSSMSWSEFPCRIYECIDAI